jgi:outer membrane protein assembly factor BamA
MQAFIVNLALVCSFTSSSQEAIDQTTVKTPMKTPHPKVGQILIVGNDRTKMSVILDQVALYPGQLLSYPELRIAERNLAQMGIFKCSPDGAVRPTIEVTDGLGGPDSEYKDVIIHVEEDDTGTASLKSGLNSEGEWVLHLVVEERNFDPFRFPCDLEDLTSGRAFRGAGLTIGLDFQLKVPVFPLRAPCASLVSKLPIAHRR